MVKHMPNDPVQNGSSPVPAKQSLGVREGFLLFLLQGTLKPLGVVTSTERTRTKLEKQRFSVPENLLCES